MIGHPVEIYDAPPRLAEVEESIIGTMIMDETAMITCLSRVLEGDFYLPMNRNLFGLIRRLYFAHGHLTQQLLVDRAIDAKMISGPHEVKPFLLAADPFHIDTLLSELVEYANKRRMRASLLESLSLVVKEEVSFMQVQSKLLKDLSELTTGGSAKYYTIPEIREQIEHGQIGVKLPIGEPILDAGMYSSSGSHLGTTEVILAHSKHGKSWYTAWRAAKYADQGIPGLVITLEDSRDEIAKRVELQMRNKDNAKLVRVTDEVFSLDDIVSMIWQAKIRDGIQFVVVDYIQIVHVAGIKFSDETPRIVTASATLTKAIKDNGVFGMIVAQPRKPDNHYGKEDWRIAPTVNTIYGSGQILKDAYTVTSLFRPNKAKDLRFRHANGMLGAMRYDNHIVNWNSVFVKTEVTRRGVEDGQWMQFIHGDKGLYMSQEAGYPYGMTNDWNPLP